MAISCTVSKMMEVIQDKLSTAVTPKKLRMTHQSKTQLEKRERVTKLVSMIHCHLGLKERSCLSNTLGTMLFHRQKAVLRVKKRITYFIRHLTTRSCSTHQSRARSNSTKSARHRCIPKKVKFNKEQRMLKLKTLFQLPEVTVKKKLNKSTVNSPMLVILTTEYLQASQPLRIEIKSCRPNAKLLQSSKASSRITYQQQSKNRQRKKRQTWLKRENNSRKRTVKMSLSQKKTRSWRTRRNQKAL